MYNFDNHQKQFESNGCIAKTCLALMCPWQGFPGPCHLTWTLQVTLLVGGEDDGDDYFNVSKLALLGTGNT